jgi:putative ABC transport system substrate-binding protein
MKRRDFVAGLMIASAMRHAVAQQPAKTKRIAIVTSVTKVADMRGVAMYRTFLEELGRHGFVEGENLVVDWYSGEGRLEHYPDLAREVISKHPDLIFVPSGVPLVLPFKSMTTEIPIVAIGGDPIATGLVRSLARPGGNVTGASVDAGYRLYAKRFELLAEAIPKLSRVGYLASRFNWESPNSSAKGGREAAERAGVSLSGILLGTDVNEAEYQRVFDSIEQYHLDGLMVSQDTEHFAYRVILVELVAKGRIPAIYPFRELVDVGGLMSYSADLRELFRHVASQTADILNGANPGEIPVYQATKFELVINLKTARALGLELPATLVATADEVIE